MRNYDPRNHYWAKADGSLYSSASMTTVPADDAVYLAWANAGGVATRYPLDEAGEESEAELAAVLAAYGLYLSESAAARAKRDAVLISCEWMVIRHRDQVDAASTTTLTTAQYAELLAYRQALRDWPATTGWPDVDMPSAPGWLAELGA